MHHRESWGVKAHVPCIDFDGGDCSLSTSCGIGLACISCHEGVSGRLAGMQCRKKKKKKLIFAVRCTWFIKSTGGHASAAFLKICCRSNYHRRMRSKQQVRGHEKGLNKWRKPANYQS